MLQEKEKIQFVYINKQNQNEYFRKTGKTP